MGPAPELAPDDRTVFAVECLRLRAWARARLYAEGLFDLQSAVDALQTWAQDLGLINAIGQDRVQAIMAQAFRESVS